MQIRMTFSPTEDTFEVENPDRPHEQAFARTLAELWLAAVTMGSGSVTQKLDHILTQQETIMLDLSKNTAELEKLGTLTNDLAGKIDAVVVADQAEDDAFRAEIAALKEQIANGEAVTQAQLDGLAADHAARNEKLSLVSEGLKAMGTNPTDALSTTPAKQKK
jgi:hypothetical protein